MNLQSLSLFAALFILIPFLDHLIQMFKDKTKKNPNSSAWCTIMMNSDFTYL